jgi:hypothetical protein
MGLATQVLDSATKRIKVFQGRTNAGRDETW